MSSPQNFAAIPGQKVITENTGVKRILGTELTTTGKVSNWMYYLIDIQSVVVYANDGNEVWYGTFGQPAAGSLAVRNSLQPFEGQRFYVVEQDIAYEWIGGAWEGGVFEGNTLSPTALILTAPTNFTAGRSHLVEADGVYVLPALYTKDGHEISFYVSTDVNASVTVSDGSDISFQSALAPSLQLQDATAYHAVYYSGSWILFAVETDLYLEKAANLGDVPNKPTARENLDVYSTEETDDAIVAAIEQAAGLVDSGLEFGTGLTKTGTVQGQSAEVVVNFATQTEADAGVVADKTISPATLKEAVEASNKSSRYNNITGLLPKVTESQFLLAPGPGNDLTLVTWPEFTGAFNLDPFVRNSALTTITYAAGQIAIPVTATLETRWLVANNTGVVSLDTAAPIDGATDRFLLGAMAILAGEIAIAGGATNLQTEPWLSSSTPGLRLSPPLLEGGEIRAVAIGNATVELDQVTWTEEGVNWVDSTTNPHVKVFGTQSTMQFVYVDRTGVILSANPTTLIDGRWYDDGSAAQDLPANDYGIHIVYLGVTGGIGILAPQTTYPDMATAVGAVSAYDPILPNVIQRTEELAKIVVKGNQFDGGAQLDLTDPDKFRVIAGAAISGSGSTSSTAVSISADTANKLTSSNVQGQLDELAAGATFAKVTGPTTLGVGSYILASTDTFTLPDPTGFPFGKVVRVYSAEGTLPVVAVDGTLAENIQFVKDITQIDTSITISNPSVVFTFVWNGTNWEI